MARQHRRTEPASAEPQIPSARYPSPVVIPRVWLIILMIMLVVPWLIAGALYVSADDEGGSSGSAVAAAIESPAGLWGRLTLTPITISPPVEYVPQNWGPREATLWHIPLANPDELSSFLASTGMGPEDTARLRSTSRRHSRAGGVVLEPDPDLVRRLSPEVRARLYLQLAQSPLNVDQLTAFRFFGTSPAAWLGTAVSPATRELVEPLIYRHNDFMYFADIESVRARIEDPAELQRLAKALHRQGTLMVTLSIDDPSDVPAIAEYWGRGGRRTDIRPLLESIAEGRGSRSIDISHLLPTLPREHLYRYPRVTVADHEKPLLANCLWTALNFFAPAPDDRLLDVQTALERLKRDYYIVHDGQQLGDVVAFSDRGGNLFHVAVYLANGLIFGKNGTTPMAPWSILPIERIKGHYVEDSEDWQVTFHRRNDL
jgi:hypothetical protein